MQHFGELHNTHIVSCIISSFLLKKDILSFQNTRGGVYGSFFIIHGQQWSLWRARTPLSLCRLAQLAQRVTHFKHWRIPSLQERDSLVVVSANSVSAAMMKTFLVDGCVGHLTPRLVQTCSTKRHPPPIKPTTAPFFGREQFQTKFKCVWGVWWWWWSLAASIKNSFQQLPVDFNKKSAAGFQPGFRF